MEETFPMTSIVNYEAAATAVSVTTSLCKQPSELKVKSSRQDVSVVEAIPAAEHSTLKGCGCALETFCTCAPAAAASAAAQIVERPPSMVTTTSTRTPCPSMPSSSSAASVVESRPSYPTPSDSLHMVSRSLSHANKGNAANSAALVVVSCPSDGRPSDSLQSLDMISSSLSRAKGQNTTSSVSTDESRPSCPTPPLDSLHSLDVEKGANNANNMTRIAESVRQEVATARPAIASCIPHQRSHVSASLLPASSASRYSAARVKQRIASDGTVAPVTEPKRSRNGLYLRPVGRTRKGMEWDAVRGIWVPSSNALASVANSTTTFAMSTSSSSHAHLSNTNTQSIHGAQKQYVATLSDTSTNATKVPLSQTFEKQPVAVDTSPSPFSDSIGTKKLSSADFVDSKLSRINQDCDNCMDDTTASAPAGCDSSASSDLSGGATLEPPATSSSTERYRHHLSLRYSSRNSCKSIYRSTPGNNATRPPLPPLTEIVTQRIALSARKSPVPADGTYSVDSNDDDEGGHPAEKEGDDRKVAAAEKQPSVSTKEGSNSKNEQVIDLTLDESSDDQEEEKEDTTTQDIQDKLLGNEASRKSNSGKTVEKSNDATITSCDTVAKDEYASPVACQGEVAVASAATPTNAAPAASAVPPASGASSKRTLATTKGSQDGDNIMELVVGERVYARWPGNNQWYFGTVRNTAVRKQNKCGRWKESKYTIEFDDGDVSQLKRMDIVKEEALKQEEIQELYYSPNDEAIGAKRKRITSDKDCNSKKKAANGPTSRLPVGMRVYARYPKNGQWYWGQVTKVKGTGRETKYDVKYDDGDKWKDLVMEDLLSEAEYSHLLACNAPRKHKKNASEIGTEMSLQQLRSRACGKCIMCRKQDCGSCQGCLANMKSTNHFKDVCLLKMCLLINDDDKAQPLPWFPNVKFLFTDPRKLSANLQKQETVHETLDGFFLVSNGRMYRGIETYLRMLRMDPTEAAVYYNELFGIELSERIDTHELLGKDYLHQWYDEALKPRAVYGVVTACCKLYGSTDGHVFTVKYENRSRELVNCSTVALKNEVPEVDCHVSERQAWAGCLLADQRGLHPPSGLGSNLQVPQRYRWIPPDSMSEELIEVEGHGSLTRRTLMVLGHMIVLQVKPSSIPGAGLGVWVSCWPVGPAYSNNQHLVLQAGDMIDIGVYAPLRVGDRKPDHLSLLKNFIHEWSCESYSFDVAPHFTHTGDILDITCDWTGTLHESARNCIMPYVNETDGIECPTIHATNDPSGAVHYLLGHSDCDLRLPLHGEEIEVKVDYGPSYEKVRVRKGYSRISKADQKALHKEVKDDDYELVVDIGRFCASEVLDGINFIEYLWRYKGAGPFPFPPKKRVRILLLLLLLRVRLLALKKESAGMDDSDDGDTSLSSKRGQDELTRLLDADHRSKAAIKEVMNEWMDSELLRESLLEPEISRIVLMRIFDSTVRSWSARVLVHNLSQL